ncbi:MAG TPA: cell division protein ZapE [Rhizomicrobium sp.]|nr:cell division protein ZapE [Rhizomicrobium sp.]
MPLLGRYRALVKSGELRADAAQEAAARRLQALGQALARYRPGRGFFFGRRPAPRGIYLWGDVGRGKSLLMDLFFADARVASKTRVHFNAFMADVHARIHAERERHGEDPIPPVARALAATLLCFDEFQVTDVADAMILGRLFRELFALGTVVVATSNTPPARLYQGGLNRQLFLPFIAMLEEELDVLELDGATDYRLERMSGLDVYITPLGADADARMDAAWTRLTDSARGEPETLTVLGRGLRVPQAAKGVARFSFGDLCAQPLAAADYLAIARHFHTLLIDRVPRLEPEMRNEARRFIVLIDTLYDEGVKLICSADAAPDALYPQGDGADAFRRTASRLVEMQSEDYLRRGHGIHGAAA